MKDNNPHPDEFSTPIKAYTPGDLVKLYGVNPKTLRRWFRRHAAAIGKREGRHWTTKQVATIFTVMGDPASGESPKEAKKQRRKATKKKKDK